MDGGVNQPSQARLQVVVSTLTKTLSSCRQDGLYRLSVVIFEVPPRALVNILVGKAWKQCPGGGEEPQV